MFDGRVFVSLFSSRNLWINEHKHQCPFCEDYYDKHHYRYVYNSFNFISQHVKYSKLNILGKHKNYILQACKSFVLSNQHIDRLYLSPFSFIDYNNSKLVYFMQNVAKCEMAMQQWIRKCGSFKLHTMLNFSPFNYLFSLGFEYRDDFYENLYDRNKVHIIQKKYHDDFKTQYNYYHNNVELGDFLFFMPFDFCAQFNQYLIQNNIPKRVVRLIMQFYGSVTLNMTQYFYRKNVFRYIRMKTSQLLPLVCRKLIAEKKIPNDTYEYLFVQKHFHTNYENILFMNYYLD